MRTLFLALMVHVVISPGAVVLHSQLPPAVLADVPHNALVRVAAFSHPPVYGRYLSSSPDSLILSAPEPRQRYSLALADIHTMWVQKGTTWKQTGVVAGLMLGTLTASLVCGLSETDGQRRNCLTLPFIYGAGIGFGIGGALGALVPRWRRFYPVDARVR